MTEEITLAHLSGTIGLHSIEDAFDPRGINLCNCIGPQSGQSKCPCSLRAEAQERLIENPFLPEDYKKRLQEWPKKKS